VPLPEAGRARAQPVAARWAIRLASVLYGFGARLDRVWRTSRRGTRGRPACAVVSVGGITVGGAGKTPVAARLAWALSQRGHRVAVASRGYRGRAREAVTVVSDATRVHSSVEQAGDESLVLTAHAPGVPVLVGRDRRVVGHHAVAAFGTEILVLDDGFQHHGLERDVDVVCLDGVEGLGNGLVLPAGPLREPPSALQHTDLLCLIDAPADPPFLAELMRWVGKEMTVWRAHRRPVGLIPLQGGPSRSPEVLAGRRVGLLAGIARPGSLRRTLEALGAEVVREYALPDHHRYRACDLAGLSESGDAGLDGWVTTEKDALKILPKWLPPGVNLEVLRVELEFEEEAGLVDAIEDRLRGASRLR